jgi:hypothetical protein
MTKKCGLGTWDAHVVERNLFRFERNEFRSTLVVAGVRVRTGVIAGLVEALHPAACCESGPLRQMCCHLFHKPRDLLAAPTGRFVS